MRHKPLYLFLGLEAVLCAAFCLSNASAGSALIAAASFPFVQIGGLLRTLSLAGAAGSGTISGAGVGSTAAGAAGGLGAGGALAGSLTNGLALALYAGLCLIPVFILGWILLSGRFQPEDSLLGLLSLGLFFTLYLCINPGRLVHFFSFLSAGFASEETLLFCEAVCGGVVWSLLAGYLTLRALRLFYNGEQAALWGYLEKLLVLLAAFFVLMAFGACLGDTLGLVKAVREGNSVEKDLIAGGNLPGSSGLQAGDSGGTGADSLAVTQFFLWFRYLTEALPWLLDVVTVFLILRLLESRRREPYSEESLAIAGKLCRFCVFSLGTCVLSSLLYQVLQLLAGKLLYDAAFTISIPIFSAGFVLAVLLITRLLEENHQLKTDNDLFI